MNRPPKRLLLLLIAAAAAILAASVCCGKTVFDRFFLRDTNVYRTEQCVCASATLKKGDYVLFGKYLGEPILWQVIDTDPNGRPLFMTVHIITFKAFDACGVDKEFHQGEDYERYGNFCT